MKILIEQANRRLDVHRLAQHAVQVVDLAATLQQIAAPTFHEQQRAAYVERQFQQAGLADIMTDGTYNVYARMPGRVPRLPALMITAHTDTVFGPDVELTHGRDATTLYGPGIGDNCMGVAGMLGAIAVLQNSAITPDRDLWFVATTCEEGLGNLRGMRAAFERLKDRIGAVINIEGLAFGHIYHAGIAVKRLHITVRTSGGHSWLHFGRPSAIHVLMQLGARIAEVRPPQQPRTTYNIGLIDGGVSINTIAASASMWLDLRSEDTTALQALEREVRQVIRSSETSDAALDIEVVGERPAGSISPDHPLVRMAVDALETVGIKAILETGSTDGNIPLAAGYPAVTVGITRGGNAHRLDEFAEIGPVEPGMQQLMTLILAASHADAVWTTD
ncbi:MAG: N-acetyl-lysine deacetylase [Anaerolineae bacterium]|nr:N-acetyl-lysine deacetylase [Anaerolineae bacterium]